MKENSIVLEIESKMCVPTKRRFLGVIISVLFIHTVTSLHVRYPSRNVNKYQPSVTEDSYQETEQLHSHGLPAIEVDSFRCPLGCVCQYAHFMDLPISRWINSMARNNNEDNDDDDAINGNEVAYEGDDSYTTNPYIKQATCILQAEVKAETLVRSLPNDLQSLILLYTGIGNIKMVNTSEFLPLNHLTTLEIRGPQDLSLRLEFDKPLSFLRHANFDSIKLMGSENSKRRLNPEHPSKSFDYKPFWEMEESSQKHNDENDTDDGDDKATNVRRPKHKKPLKETIIMPYDIYKRFRMPNFYGWDNLEVLRIRGCSLNELNWEMFDGLAALQHLSLESNEIAKVPPFAFYGALHIRTLSLAHNNVSSLHYRDLAGLLELETLDLSDNRLTELSELSFPPFPKLGRVDFRNNPIRYIYPATFWVMNGTRSMELRSNGEQPLELWGNVPFESLAELQELSIENLLITSLEQNVFKGLISLEKLKLRGHIRRIEFDAFSSLGELRELDLSECHIEEVSMDSFVGCKKLRVLNLANNQLRHIPSGLFDEQSKLEEIYLQANRLPGLPTNFFQLPQLRLARLNDNPWHCSCDMMSWRAKITNQERGPAVDHCITDYFTGKALSCRRSSEYKFNNRFAPRCENFNRRGVFYVLRKHLQCEQDGRVIHSGKHRVRLDQARVPTWRKIELLQQQHQGVWPLNATNVAARTQREQKYRTKYAKRQNSLEVALQTTDKDDKDDNEALGNGELSNNI